MEQQLLTEQIILPSFDIHSVASAKSNYVNYQSNSSTKNANALIDVIEGITICVEGPEGLSNTI